ncbi:glycosyltransferase family 4 protein [Candidatus Beckwithbacteria bacterium]|nr:glycosyltransferase family 4 protein [Candidatus Beckwithbacteria bacterium]
MKDISSRIKKVLFISSLYRPNVGGVETTIEELANKYRNLGIEVAVLTKRYPFNLPELETINQVPIYRIIRPKNEKDYLKSIDWLKYYNSSIKADIIHLFQVHRPMPLYGLLLSKLWKVPLVINYAGGDIPEPNDPFSQKMWKEGEGIVKESLLQADQHISFSKSLSNYVKKVLPEIKKIDLIYAGLDTNKIANSEIYKPGYDYFVSIRRLEKDKGIDILIKAFNMISVNYPRIHLIIVGDGSDRKNLEHLVDTLDSKEKIHFVGTIKLEETFKYLRGAIANICPSRAEAGGIINFAAQAAGTVAIGSNIGGIPEYINHNKTGLLFHSEDIKELSFYLSEVIKNRKLRANLINNSLEKVKEYDWENIAKKYLLIYEKLINNYIATDFKPWSILSKKMWDQLKNDF